MSHLIHTARELSQKAAGQSVVPIDCVVLPVRRDNPRAINFYEKCGFELLSDVVRQEAHQVMKLWIGESGN